MTALLRTFRRAKLSIPHSQGFHPKPLVSFGPACPVGTASEAEYLDLQLNGSPAPAHVAAHVRAELPEGFRLLSCEPIDRDAPALNQSIRGIEYLVELPDGAPDAIERLAAFAALPDATIVREREGKTPVRIDLKAAVQGLIAETSQQLRFTLRAGEAGAVARPVELLTALFGADCVKPGVARLVRESVVFGAPAV
jgi:radical SAM-linked protein